MEPKAPGAGEAKAIMDEAGMGMARRWGKAAAAVAAGAALSGCFVDVGLSTVISASQRAKQAKAGIETEKKAKADLEKALEAGASNQALAVGQIEGAAAPETPGARTEAAMKAAEEQSK